MSTITYKFRNAKSDFHTITFEGPVINVLDLKKGIISQSKFNIEDSARSADFDLVVANQQTGEEYRDNNTLIPRNTLVVIHRVPATSMKAAKLFEPLTNPVVPAFNALKKSMVSTADNEFGSPLYTEKDGEKKKNDVEVERSAMFHVQEANRPEMSKPVPGSGGFLTQPGSNYICHRCGVAGHWIRNCPTNNDKNFVPIVKRLMTSTGLPSTSHHVPVEKPDSKDPQRIIVNGKVLMPADIDLEENTLIPGSFRCDICMGILRTATFVPCCKKSFCEECIRQHILREGIEIKCPTCANIIGEDDELEKNVALQTRVDDYRKQQDTLRQQRKSIKSSTTKSDATDEYIQKKSTLAKKKSKSKAKFTSFGAKLSTTAPLSCLNCHENGHVFKDCPKLQDDFKKEPPRHPADRLPHKPHKPSIYRTPQPIPNSLISSLGYPSPLLNLRSAWLNIGAHSFADATPLPNSDKIKIAAYFGPFSEYRKKSRRKRYKARRRSHSKHRRSRSSSRLRTPKRRRHKRSRSRRVRKTRKKYYSSTRSRSKAPKRRHKHSRSPTPNRRSPTPRRRSPSPRRRRHSHSRSPSARPTTKHRRYSHKRSLTPKRRSKRVRTHRSRPPQHVNVAPPLTDKWMIANSSSSPAPDSPKLRKRFQETSSPSSSPVPLSYLSEVLRSPPSSPETKERVSKTGDKSEVKLNGKKNSDKSDKEDKQESKKHKPNLSTSVKKRKSASLVSEEKRKLPSGTKRETNLQSSGKKRKATPPCSSLSKSMKKVSEVLQKKRIVRGSHRVILKHDQLSKLHSRRRIVTSRSNNCSNEPIVFGPFLPRKKPKLINTTRQVIRKSA